MFPGNIDHFICGCVPLPKSWLLEIISRCFFRPSLNQMGYLRFLSPPGYIRLTPFCCWGWLVCAGASSEENTFLMFLGDHVLVFPQQGPFFVHGGPRHSPPPPWPSVSRKRFLTEVLALPPSIVIVKMVFSAIPVPKPHTFFPKAWAFYSQFCPPVFSFLSSLTSASLLFLCCPPLSLSWI